MSLANLNLIDKELWDAARWREIVFLVTPDLDSQPGIGIQFENIDAGIGIFNQWHNRFGVADREELLRVSILRGQHPKKGNGYAVHFSTDISVLPPASSKEKAGYVFAGSRWFFKPTEHQQSLDWFRSSFEKYKMYFLLPLPMKITDPSPYMKYMLGKTKIYCRDFTSIESDDQDAVTLDA